MVGGEARSEILIIVVAPAFDATIDDHWWLDLGGGRAVLIGCLEQKRIRVPWRAIWQP